MTFQSANDRGGGDFFSGRLERVLTLPNLGATDPAKGLQRHVVRPVTPLPTANPWLTPDQPQGPFGRPAIKHAGMCSGR